MQVWCDHIDKQQESYTCKKADGSGIMDKLVLFTFLDGRSLSEIAEFRSVLEPAVTELACRKATAEDIESLSSIYRQMLEHRNDLEGFAKLDHRFHTEIARISGNPYIIKIYEALEQILDSAFSEIVRKNGNSGGWRYHGQIVEAFKNGEHELAAGIMRDHMNRLAEEYGNCE